MADTDASIRTAEGSGKSGKSTAKKDADESAAVSGSPPEQKHAATGNQPDDEYIGQPGDPIGTGHAAGGPTSEPPSQGGGGDAAPQEPEDK